MDVAVNLKQKNCKFKSKVNGRCTKQTEHRKKRKNKDSVELNYSKIEDKDLRVIVSDVSKDPKFSCTIAKSKKKSEVDEPCCALDSIRSQDEKSGYTEVPVKMFPATNGPLEIPAVLLPETPPPSQEPYLQVNGFDIESESEKHEAEILKPATLPTNICSLNVSENNKNKGDSTGDLNSLKALYKIKECAVQVEDCTKTPVRENHSSESKKHEAEILKPATPLTNICSFNVNGIEESLNCPASLYNNDESPKDSGICLSDSLDESFQFSEMNTDEGIDLSSSLSNDALQISKENKVPNSIQVSENSKNKGDSTGDLNSLKALYDINECVAQVEDFIKTHSSVSENNKNKGDSTGDLNILEMFYVIKKCVVQVEDCWKFENDTFKPSPGSEAKGGDF